MLLGASRMPLPMLSTTLRSVFRRGSVFALVVLLLVLVTLDKRPYDDAYFFLRIARNALNHATLAWNVGEAPVYGITAQLFLLPVVGVAALFGDYALIGTRLFLAACLVLAFVVQARERRAASLGAAVALTSPIALFSVLSGMETAFAILLVALGLELTMAARPTRTHAWAPACLLVLAWLARPDTLMLLLPAFALHCVRRSRAGVYAACFAGLALGGFLLFFHLFYGTALPLPFYAKQLGLSPYDAEFLAVAKTTQLRHFGLFALTILPLLLVALRRLDRETLLVLASAALFTSYHALATVDIMGMHARFFAPALPLFVHAAGRALEHRPASGQRAWLFAGVYAVCAWGMARPELLPSPSLPADHRVPAAYYVCQVGAGLLFLVSAHRRTFAKTAQRLVLGGAALAVVVSHGFTVAKLPSDDAYLDAHERNGTVFRGLSTVRECFGDAVRVYHSEVGVPGLRFERGRIVDLAGLFTPEWLFGERTFDELCARDNPEVIFLPHRNYREYNQRVKESRCLEGYARVIAKSASPLYVRRDLVDRYAACRDAS